MSAGRRGWHLPLDVGREPVILALLFITAIVCFAGVSWLANMYGAHQQALGTTWYTRGVADLNAKRYKQAASDFRAALLYSRDNFAYRLNLAEALVGLGRANEADAYFVNLWDRQPENGLVNLELARISAQRKEVEQALRYYHNAIYAIWPSGQQGKREEVRLELIHYLLNIHAKQQAQAELIALSSIVNDNAAQQAQIGDLFVQADDSQDALDAYRQSLRVDPDNHMALAGAGRIAFNLSQYSLAQHYLREAVMADPNDKQSADMLATTKLVLQMDPYRRGISVADRNRIAAQAFAAGGQRLTSCSPANASEKTPLAALADSWAKLKPKVTERGFRRDPNLAESVMDLVFNIERQTSAACGSPSGVDLALLLISQLHEGG